MGSMGLAKHPMLPPASPCFPLLLHGDAQLELRVRPAEVAGCRSPQAHPCTDLRGGRPPPYLVLSETYHPGLIVRTTHRNTHVRLDRGPPGVELEAHLAVAASAERDLEIYRTADRLDVEAGMHHHFCLRFTAHVRTIG